MKKKTAAELALELADDIDPIDDDGPTLDPDYADAIADRYAAVMADVVRILADADVIAYRLHDAPDELRLTAALALAEYIDAEATLCGHIDLEHPVPVTAFSWLPGRLFCAACQGEPGVDDRAQPCAVCGQDAWSAVHVAAGPVEYVQPRCMEHLAEHAHARIPAPPQE